MANETSISSTTNAAVAGFFRDDDQAENAIEELRNSGFSDQEIGVATRHEEGSIRSFWDKLANKFGKHEHDEGADHLEGSLRDSGVPEQQAGYFNSQLAQGGVLVTVHAGPDRAAQAVSILQRNGAEMGTAAAEWQASRDAGSAPTQTTQRMQLLGEILRVHKERVSRGEVRFRKEVITERQTVEVPTTREELVVERVAGSGSEAAAGDIGSGENEIRIPLSEERVTVEKKPVVNEEIRIGKRQVQDKKTVTDDVRHEELRTETDGDINNSGMSRTKDKARKTA